MFQLIRADVSNQPHITGISGVGDNRKTRIVMSRYKKVLQLISQSLDSIFAIRTNEINITISLR